MCASTEAPYFYLPLFSFKVAKHNCLNYYYILTYLTITYCTGISILCCWKIKPKKGHDDTVGN